MTQQSVNAEVVVQGQNISVTAAAGSGGQTVNIHTKTVLVRLTKSRIGGPIEYKFGDSEWAVLDEEQGKALAYDLSTTALLLRKASPFAGGVDVWVEYHILSHFVLDGKSVPLYFDGEMTIQAPRSGNFTVVPSDSNSVILVEGGNSTVTFDTNTKLTGPVQIKLLDAATLSIIRTGVTAYNSATQANWSTLQVTGKYQSIVMEPTDDPLVYEAYKLGVA